MTPLLLLLLGLAQADTLPDCSTPSSAADTLLGLLPPHANDPAGAATCMNVPEDLADEREELAVKLKKVMDAQGWYVDVASLPDRAEDATEEEYVLVPQRPVITVEQVGDQWMYSEDTVRAIPGLYRETFAGVGAWLEEVLPPWFSTTRIGPFHPWQGVLFLLLSSIAALATLAANLLSRSWLQQLVQRFGVGFDASVLDRTKGPIRLLAIGLVFMWGIPDLQLTVKPSQALLFIARVLVSVGAVGIGIRWVDVFGRLFAERAERTETRMDDQAIPLATRLVKMVVVALGMVFVLSNLGVDVASLVAGLGIGGVALAFGAQDTVANLFGGLTVFTDQPFQVGDWVIVGGGVEGTVEEVGFRSTRIRAFSGSVISVPNSKIANSNVENMSRRPYRRCRTTLGLTYDTTPEQLQAFVEGIRGVLKAHPQVKADAYEVHFRAFGASSLDVLVQYFLDVPTWNAELSATSQIYRQILRLASDLNVAFAFPSQSLYLEASPDRPLPPRQVPTEMARIVQAYGPEGDRSNPEDLGYAPDGYGANPTERGSDDS